MEKVQADTQFQSTLSVRRATHHQQTRMGTVPISIHALREESDLPIHGRSTHRCVRFQSTLSVRRATRIADLQEEADGLFQSTLSVRRATTAIAFRNPAVWISIHALREESDSIQPVDTTIIE